MSKKLFKKEKIMMKIFNEGDGIFMDEKTLKALKQEHPFSNPLVESNKIKLNKKLVTVGALGKQLADTATGELYQVNGIAKITEVDQRTFVQVFRDGIKEMYELSRPAQRVFTLILEHYEKQSFERKKNWNDEVMLYVDSVKKTVNQDILPMSYPTFRKGLIELMMKNFIRIKVANIYWINPHLFFCGDKVSFIKHYRVVRPAPKLNNS